MELHHKEMLLASLEKHNACEVTVGGTSMWPFIKHGDVLSLRYKPFKPRLGAVVGFFYDNQLIVHRIIWYKRKKPQRWEVCVHGDASPFSLAKIDSEEIVGTVEYIKRGKKIIKSWFRYPLQIAIIPIGFLLQTIVAAKLYKEGKEQNRTVRQVK